MRRRGGPTMRNRKSARVSSMSSPSKRIGWGFLSELSGSPEQRPRSEWPISSTTSNALSSCARSPSHDRLVLRKATHSTHYPIAIRLNQQLVFADLRHAEINSLIESSMCARSQGEFLGANASCREAYQRHVASRHTMTQITATRKATVADPRGATAPVNLSRFFFLQSL